MADPERYATVTQLRAEGLVDDGSGPTDDQLVTWLDRASQLVEFVTKNFFYEISGTVTFDGNNSHILHLPWAIREVTSLKINGETAALDTDQYTAWIGNTPIADYRKNPKIELRQGSSGSIYTNTFGLPLKFRKGLDQVVEGKFGYLDPPLPGDTDDRVPPVINEVVMVIVMTIAATLYDRFGGNVVTGGSMVGTLKREKTDGHEIEFHQMDDSSIEEGSLFIPYISNRLRLFKAPIGIRVTSQRWFESGVV